MFHEYWQATIVYQYSNCIEHTWVSDEYDFLEDLNNTIEYKCAYLKRKKGGYFEIDKRIDNYIINSATGSKRCQLSIWNGDLIIYD